MADDDPELTIGAVIRWDDERLRSMIYACVDEFTVVEGKPVALAHGLGRHAGKNFILYTDDFNLQIADEPFPEYAIHSH